LVLSENNAAFSVCSTFQGAKNKIIIPSHALTLDVISAPIKARPRSTYLSRSNLFPFFLAGAGLGAERGETQSPAASGRAE